ALAPVLLMFGDDDGDDGSIDCAEITVWNYALNADEVAALGGFGHLVSVEGDEATALVSEYEMEQNYPNPFNPETSISYALLHSGPVRLEVYNTLGRKMATLVDEHQESGRHSVRLSGAGWPSGVYFYKLSVNGFTQTRKMFLCR
ncbi:MAG TPA: T9SS type A sorting domain-containing protein, partial [bacterium]|nr:T9SS type A sorting domain-containing protein [bacterium]